MKTIHRWPSMVTVGIVIMRILNVTFCDKIMQKCTNQLSHIQMFTSTYTCDVINTSFWSIELISNTRIILWYPVSVFAGVSQVRARWEPGESQVYLVYLLVAVLIMRIYCPTRLAMSAPWNDCINIILLHPLYTCKTKVSQYLIWCI